MSYSRTEELLRRRLVENDGNGNIKTTKKGADLTARNMRDGRRHPRRLGRFVSGGFRYGEIAYRFT